MSLSKRELVLLAILLVVGLFYLECHYVLAPLNIKTSQLRVDNYRLSTDLQTFKQRVNEQRDIRLEEERIQSDYAKIAVKLPLSPMIPDIIDFLETNAKESDIKLLSINYKESADVKSVKNKETANPAAQTVAINISASGSHYNLLSFLVKLEHAPRIYIVNRSKITMAQNSIFENSLEASTPQQEGNEFETKNIAAVPEKESQKYDQNKSIINIDFTAYYDSPLKNQ